MLYIQPAYPVRAPVTRCRIRNDRVGQMEKPPFALIRVHSRFFRSEAGRSAMNDDMRCLLGRFLWHPFRVPTRRLDEDTPRSRTPKIRRRRLSRAGLRRVQCRREASRVQGRPCSHSEIVILSSFSGLPSGTASFASTRYGAATRAHPTLPSGIQLTRWLIHISL